MSKQQPSIQPFTFLKTAVNTLSQNTLILYPFVILAFLQLLALEILYFIPRFPLNKILGPIVSTLWADNYLRYPFDLLLLPKLFYYAQVALYFAIGGYLVAVTIVMIRDINSDQPVNLKASFKEALSRYIHILLASVFSFIFYFGFSKGYDLLAQRAMQIRSEKGIFFLIKKTIILGEPYAQFFFGILLTTLLIYVAPIIMIEKKKIFSALVINFKTLFRSFWFTLFIVFFPTILYFPVLVIRSNIFQISNVTFPEIQLWVIVLSIIATILIDAVVITAATIFYLFKKENQ
jgi:hypothetical protein